MTPADNSGPRKRSEYFVELEGVTLAYGRGEKQVKALGLTDLKLQQGDFRTDPIGKEYDIIIAGLTLHHLTWEERENFYQTLYAALNQGGLFLARDVIIDEDQSVVQAQYSSWKEFMGSQGEDPELWYSKHIEKDHPMTLSDHFAWLRKAGFSKVACHWRLYNFAITTAEKA